MSQSYSALTLTVSSLLAGVMLFSSFAEARSCADLRALCWTMRSDKSDCTGPYNRCRKTGVFITPLGRVFKATSR